ncbi:MAG: hypothetical protein QM718_12015 [Steroidobacteraceae bacterium]
MNVTARIAIGLGLAVAGALAGRMLAQQSAQAAEPQQIEAPLQQSAANATGLAGG